VKIAEILISFLQKNKSLSLPGLGTFNLSDVAHTLPDKDQPAGFPPGAVSFQWNARTPEDPALIAEISSVTGKIKPLASSDLEAIVIQGKQLINISKPFMIEGLGSIQKNHKGEIEFIPFVNEDFKEGKEKKYEEPGEAIHFNENYLKPETKRPARSRGLTLASMIFVGILLLGWVGYYVYQQSVAEDKPRIIMEKEPMAIQDTTVTQPRLEQDPGIVQQTVDTTTLVHTEPTSLQAGLDNTPVSVSSTQASTDAVNAGQLKADSVAAPVAKKRELPKKKASRPKTDSSATRISIPLKTADADLTAPVDSLNLR
jgi:hypothetical protein